MDGGMGGWEVKIWDILRSRTCGDFAGMCVDGLDGVAFVCMLCNIVYVCNALLIYNRVHACMMN